MRLRRETDRFSWKIWLKVFLLLLVIFNALVAGVLLSFSLTTFSFINGLLMPLFLSISTEQSMRTGRLYVSGFGDEPTLKALLQRKLETEKYQVEVIGNNWTCLPLGWFFKMSHRLFKVEQITVQWGDELTIEGNMRAIGLMDDYLTWNKEVKALPTSLAHG